MAFNLKLTVGFIAALLACSAAAFAQSTPSPAPSATPAAPADPCGSILSIVNRPTIGTGVCTVQWGHVDIETGYVNTITTGTGGGVTSSYGASLIRFGTNNSHLDIELTPPNASRATFAGTSVSGSTDSAIGAKYELGYNAKAVWGVNAQAIFPTGSQAFTAGGTQYVGNFNWAYTLSSVFGINGTVGLNQFRAFNAAGASQSYFAFIPTLEATATLPGSTELFAEYAYFSQTGIRLPSKSELDFGILHDLGPHLQVDAEYGTTPTVINGQQQHYVGAGLSFMN